MKRTLIVYYSRTGYTRRIASAVAERIGADLEEIKEDRTRKGMVEFFRSAIEAYRGRPAKIHAAVNKPDDYDLVIFGSPVWAGRISSPMLGYLQRHWNKVRDYGVFCTVGGSDGAVALRQFKQELGHAAKAEMILTDKEIDTGKHGLLVEDFIEALELSARKTAETRTRAGSDASRTGH